MTHEERLQAVLLYKQAGGWQTADTVSSFIPFVGGAKDVGKGIYNFSQGQWGKGIGNTLWGLGSLALDTFTGGLGSAVAKGGLKVLGKAMPMAFAKALPWTAGAGGMAWGMDKMLPQQPQQPEAAPQAAPQAAQAPQMPPGFGQFLMGQQTAPQWGIPQGYYR